MTRISRPLVALASLSSALVLAVAGPAMAAGWSQSDPTSDVKWSSVGSIGSATTQERARIDLTWGAVWMDSTRLYARYHVRNWANICTTGVPCSGNVTSYRLTLFRADGKAGADLTFQQGTAVGVQGGNVNWWTTAGGGLTCQSGQVTRAVNAANDWVTIAVPRWCFSQGWRFTKASWQDSYGYYPSNTRSRSGYDNTVYRAVDLTPKP